MTLPYPASHMAGKVNAFSTAAGYEGPFLCEAEEDPDDENKITVDIQGGEFVMASQIITLGDTEVLFDKVTAKTKYVVLEAYSKPVVGVETVFTRYKILDEYPQLDKQNVDGSVRYVYPRVLAIIIIDSEGLFDIDQRQYGDIQVASCIS